MVFLGSNHTEVTADVRSTTSDIFTRMAQVNSTFGVITASNYARAEAAGGFELVRNTELGEFRWSDTLPIFSNGPVKQPICQEIYAIETTVATYQVQALRSAEVGS